MKAAATSRVEVTQQLAGAESTKAVCVTVLGTGSIGMRHLAVLSGIPGVRTLAVSMRPTRRQELTKKGFATAQDLEEAVRLGSALCLVATDTGRHAQDALAALDRGLDVLVEKPLATDAQEGRRVTARAQELRRKVFVGCVLRFSESLHAFRERLHELGPVHTVRIECQSYLPDWRPHRSYQQSYSARPDEGGVLRDLIHEIDYAGWLFGWPAAVHARLRNLGRLGIAAEELADVSWETSTGCLVSITLDYLSQPTRRRMRACGARGSLEWDGVAGRVTASLQGSSVTEQGFAQARDAMFLAQTAAFIEAAQGGGDSRLATGDDGVKALAVCDAARRSSASRREEPVVYP